MNRTLIGVSILAAAALLSPPTQAAESPSDFYKGKTVTMVISSAPGGGYDAYARTIARHLPNHLPGNPTVVVQNMAGAGGLTATNHLYNVASKDGLTIGLIQNTVPFEPFYGNTQAQFDPTKFEWLGSPSKETGLLLLWYTVPVNTLEEAKSRELLLGASGAASTPAFYARVLTAVFGLKIKLINGYTGQTESFLGMERGENEGYSSVFWSSLKSTKPEWVRDKKVKLLVQYGAAPHPDLKDVPFADDLIKDPEKKLLMQVAAASLAIGRPVLAPPGLPADRLGALRKGMEDTLKDKAFVEDCNKQSLECNDPSNGKEMAEILDRVYSAPASVKKTMQEIYNVK
jgi:tripartite-type tricarboxylate transporter receptor subunit TctC